MKVSFYHSVPARSLYYSSKANSNRSNHLFERFNTILETHIENQQFQLAAKELQGILVSTPKVPSTVDLRHQVYFFLGLSYRYLNKQERANEYFQHVYRLEETYGDALPSFDPIIKKLKQSNLIDIKTMLDDISEHYIGLLE